MTKSTHALAKQFFCFPLVYNFGERPLWPIATTKEKRGRLRGDGDDFKFVDFGLERRQVARSWAGRGRNYVRDLKSHVFSTNLEFLDKFTTF